MIQGLHDLFLFGIQVHGKAAYPGLGTFKINRRPASYSHDRKILHPPSSNLVLDPGFEPVYNIKNWGQKLSIPDSIQQAWYQQINEFLNSENKSILLPEIGALEKHGDIISFKEIENAEFFNAFKGWPSLDISPLPIQINDIQFAVESPGELKFKGKKREEGIKDLLIPILISSLVLLFLLARWMGGFDKQNKTEMAFKNSIVSETITYNDTTVVHHAERNKSPQPELSKYSPRPDTSTKIMVSKKEHEDNKSQKPIVQFNSIERASCTYVVGAFTIKKNAERLKAKLTRQGYQVRISPHDSFHRVGVITPCNIDSYSRFKNLKARFPQLWLLEE